MATAIGDVLPLAVGVAISPTSIVIVILILLTQGARSKGILFLVGWLSAMGLVAGIIIYLTNLGRRVEIFDRGITISPIILVAVGLLLMIFGVLEWRSRAGPGDEDEEEMPGWMRLTDSVTPAKALGLGGYLSVGFPKNLMLVVGAAVVIADANLSAGNTTIALVIFIILASLGIGIPIGSYLAGGDAATTRLNRWKVALLANDTAIVAVMLLVFGAYILGKGIGQFGDWQIR